MTARALGCALAATAALAARPPASFDCLYRQTMLDYAASLQPWRAPALFAGMADALNGAIEAQNCSVAPAGGAAPRAARDAARFVHRALPAAGAAATFYIDAAAGDDGAAGTLAAPFKTVPRGLAATRAAAPAPGTLVLRGGTYFLAAPLALGAGDANLTIQGYAGEAAWISGGAPLAPAWAPVNTSKGSWSAPMVGITSVFAALPGPHIKIVPNVPSAAACEAACVADAAWGCDVWTWHDAQQGGYALDCYERSDGAWQPVAEAGHVSGYKSPDMNVWAAPLGAGAPAVTGLRHADGSRATRARYPNARPETEGFSSSLYASAWACSDCATNTLQPDYQYTNISLLRNTTAANWFQHHQMGIGGHCNQFSPPGGYWCGNSTMGGGAFTWRVPYAMTATAAVLPHLPYASPAGAIVQTWRPGHWASWMLEVANITYNASGAATFNFLRGGFQGGRGANEGGEIFVEGVREELDAPDEWHFDAATGELTWFFNATSGTPPPAAVVATSLQSLVRVVGTAAAPARGITLAGLGFRDTAYSFMEPHGMPSGGDWALRRDAALFLDGTEDVVIDGCVMERLDGNAVMLSGYNRRAAITRNEFAFTGDSVIASWGRTTSADATLRALAPGLGEDATGGDFPAFTNASFNWVHELGVFEKQSSAIFQAVTSQNHYEGNVIFNGPRAGINFNDGFGGGSNLTRNIVFNQCRESSDHGPFNCA